MVTRISCADPPAGVNDRVSTPSFLALSSKRILIDSTIGAMGPGAAAGAGAAAAGAGAGSALSLPASWATADEEASAASTTTISAAGIPKRVLRIMGSSWNCQNGSVLDHIVLGLE